MHIYAHRQGSEDPELIEIEATASVRELLAGSDDGDGDGLIWVDEHDDPVELDITLEAAGIGHRHHVHRGRCRTVEVRVRFNSETDEREFRPAATIARVFAWATGPKGFDLPAEQIPKHVLAVPGADHFLDANVHIGSLVARGRCEVILDLLPKDRFEG